MTNQTQVGGYVVFVLHSMEFSDIFFGMGEPVNVETSDGTILRALWEDELGESHEHPNEEWISKRRKEGYQSYKHSLLLRSLNERFKWKMETLDSNVVLHLLT